MDGTDVLTIAHPHPLCNPKAISSCVARDGLSPFGGADMRVAGELARSGVGGALAGGEVFAAVQAACGCAAFAYRREGRLTGALAVIPLAASGAAALAADAFDGVAPDRDHVARAGERLAAVYGWGIVGAERRARAAVLAAVHRLRVELYPMLPFYCRAATAAGERVILGRLGYRPMAGSRSGLHVSPPLGGDVQRAAA